MKRRITLSWLLMALICLPMFAQMQDPVRFKTEWKNLSANEAEIIFTGTMDQGWHVYSRRHTARGFLSGTPVFCAFSGPETALGTVGFTLSENPFRGCFWTNSVSGCTKLKLI